MARFDWSDPFSIETQLSDEERMVRDAAAGFAQPELQPRIVSAYRIEASAPELFQLMGEAGLLGVTMPEQFGGAGASWRPAKTGLREVREPDGGDTDAARRWGARL